MSQALATTEQTPLSPAVMEMVVVGGDLSKLSAPQRLEYYARVCESVGLNPLTKPFLYITLNNKLTLYAARDATDQIRERRHISVTIASRERHEDVYVVTARATTPDGRTDESIGAVAIAGLKGEALANALMKAETKAKRRVTLSIGGLGWLDETEVASVPDARPANVNMDTGEFVDVPASLPAPREERLRENVQAAIKASEPPAPTLGTHEIIEAEYVTEAVPFEDEPNPAKREADTLINDRSDPYWLGWQKLCAMALDAHVAEIPKLALPVRLGDLELVGRDLKDAIKRARNAQGATV